MAPFLSSIFKSKITVAFFAFILAIAIKFISGFNGYYGQDSYAYWLYAKQLTHFFVTAEKPAPFFWPIIYPLIGALFSLGFNSMLVLQLISCVAFAITVYVVCCCIEILTGNKNDVILFVSLTLILSPYFFRLAVCSMSDMTCCMFCAATLRSFLLLQKQKSKYFFSVILFASLAFYTRYASVILLMPILVVATLLFLKNFNLKIFLLSILCVAIVTSVNLYFNAHLFQNALHHPLAEGWKLNNFFENDFITLTDGVHIYPMSNLISMLAVFFHPGFSILIPLILLMMIWKKEFKIHLASIICVITYILFLAGLPEQNTRLLSLCFPFVIVGFYNALNFLTTEIFLSFKKIVIPIYISASLFMIWFALKPINNMSKNEKAVITFLQSQSASKPIYTTGLTAALEAYEIKNPITDLWTETPIDKFNSACFLIIDESNIRGQWNESVVSKNISALKQELKLASTELQPDTIIGGYSIYSR